VKRRVLASGFTPSRPGFALVAMSPWLGSDDSGGFSEVVVLPPIHPTESYFPSTFPVSQVTPHIVLCHSPPSQLSPRNRYAYGSCFVECQTQKNFSLLSPAHLFFWFPPAASGWFPFRPVSHRVAVIALPYGWYEGLGLGYGSVFAMARRSYFLGALIACSSLRGEFDSRPCLS